MRAYALHDCLKRAGYDSNEFSGHSFRRGAAFAAAEAGYTPEQIKLLGRCKSDAWKLSIDQPLSILRDLSSSLHRAVLPLPTTRPVSTPPSSTQVTIQTPRPAPHHAFAVPLGPSPLRTPVVERPPSLSRTPTTTPPHLPA
ncbi:hypothetical protein DFH08DRAFT_949904 [Mycena albidolilacea]|uniref:Tyr recombinase domain-containing protein n=1 Tax=Mycena albidolilacea TaxID=1033008 RepID=A0AAD7F3T4_9AGAR|nr:hypothetical protein DFH08DRAFT_949904 [Mycena albidolilacea]